MTRKTHYDPKIHIKTKGGLGFHMKRGIKTEEWESHGGQLAEVFGWTLPPHIQKLKDEYLKKMKRKKFCFN